MVHSRRLHSTTTGGRDDACHLRKLAPGVEQSAVAQLASLAVASGCQSSSTRADRRSSKPLRLAPTSSNRMATKSQPRPESKIRSVALARCSIRRQSRCRLAGEDGMCVVTADRIFASTTHAEDPRQPHGCWRRGSRRTCGRTVGRGTRGRTPASSRRRVGGSGRSPAGRKLRPDVYNQCSMRY